MARSKFRYDETCCAHRTLALMLALGFVKISVLIQGAVGVIIGRGEG